VDYGKHTITDYNAKPFDTFIIKAILVSEEGEVTVKLQEKPTEGGNGPCTFRGGDFVEFSEIDGMVELNAANTCLPIRIKDKKRFEFKLKIDSEGK